MPLSGHVYCVAVTFKMTEQVEQWICIKFCIKLQYCSTETVGMIQMATPIGNWWLAASSPQRTCLCITSHAEFSGETSNHPGDPVPLQPRFSALWLLAFPKLKSSLKGKRFQISEHWWDSGKYNQAADGDWENCVRSQGAYFEGIEVSLSYIQCFLYLVSSSINVSIFHSMWLDTFWTDLILTGGPNNSCFGFD